jgi:hypothetical protein
MLFRGKGGVRNLLFYIKTFNLFASSVFLSFISYCPRRDIRVLFYFCLSIVFGWVFGVVKPLHPAKGVGEGISKHSTTTEGNANHTAKPQQHKKKGCNTGG